MKFIFVVQGEGRGHMTQAISLFQILTKNGHEISHVIVGKSRRKILPEFFRKNIKTTISQLESPTFVTDRKSKSIIIFKTLLINLCKAVTFLRSVEKINQIVKQERPDAIINFYEFIGGLYFFMGKRKPKHIALAHQFLLNHSEFEFPKGRIYDRTSLLVGNKLASYKANKRLCLSFQPMKNEKKKRIFVVPPLLREEIKKMKPSQKEYFLVYIVNHGYSEQVAALHARHPEISIHCFWDKKDAQAEMRVDETLTFHALDDKKFIEYIAGCKGYLTTAGFESICEATYFGKPVLMTPVRGHYEQSCNALDAQKAGAGISSTYFDLEQLLNYLPNHKNSSKSFQNWAAKAEQMFIKLITEDDF